MKSASNKKAPSARQLRVGEHVRQALASFLQRQSINDPLLTQVLFSVSEVSMSPDLKTASCYIVPLGNADGAEVVQALNRHASFVRGAMSNALRQLKYMPQFRFYLDTSFDNFSRIDALLRSPEVARDLEPQDNSEDKT